MGKKIISFILAMLLFGMLLFGCASNGNLPGSSNNDDRGSMLNEAKPISFTDDDGRQINIDKPCERIISLYSAHTENLYTLGVGDKIIGVHKTSIYPPDAAKKDVYDYEADPEKIIAAEPDVVIIRPFITRKVPDFVKTLEKAGALVVSLYPESLDQFDSYISRLAQLTGTEDRASEELEKFYKNIDAITELTKGVTDKQKVFFESTEVNLRTITPDSMPGRAIEFAGGENIAKDAKPINKGSSIASFGAEKILSLADQIDIYVSQRGAMNAGGNIHSIVKRNGFDTIKAIKDNTVFLINEKIISSPTFRYYKGIKELARFMYPDVIDDLSNYKNDTQATKRDFANILVQSAHMPIYITASSSYYNEVYDGHTYGWFEDVTWEDADFDYIETAVMRGCIGYEVKGDKQYFKPENPVTREELAKAVFLLKDYENIDSHITIKDLNTCEKASMIQILVDNKVFDLNNGKFEPDRLVTNAEIVEALSK